MKDLTIVILFFAEIALIVAILLIFLARIRFLNQVSALSKKRLNTLKKKDLPLFYSTADIRSEVTAKFLHRPPKKEIVLSRIAYKNPAYAAKFLERAVKKEPQNIKLLLLDAEISQILHHQNRFSHIMEQIRLPRFLSKNIKAQYLRLNASNELFQTDMLTASKDVSKALKIYQKLNFSYEEAECYWTLAQIYRISGVFDVAFTMLKEAKKIYKDLKINAKIAETEAYFGLNEIGRENYQTASEYLTKASKICIKYNLHNTLADIENWQGLIAFLTKHKKEAEKMFTNALNKTQNLPTKTFAAEMLTRIYMQNQNFNKAMEYNNLALTYAKKQQHRPAIFENLYLKAEIYYTQKQYDECRKVLTALIKEKTPPSAIYYPANAYTLLGLVEFKQNNTDMARTLFKQALDLEHAANRLKGAALDYNNLAEVSRLTGNLPETEKYLHLALKYAEEIEDEELQNYLKSKLS